jgi:diguanylate cyclase (GGDEF)-like protein
MMAVHWARAMLQLQNEILVMVATGEPLADTMDTLCRGVEASLPGVVCSVLAVGMDGCLHPLAGPSLPRDYCDALDGLAPGADVGSCGSAVHLKRPVEVIDIATDPRWAAYAARPLSLGLRACWSTPIMARDGGVLGAFAFYFREPRRHTPQEAQVVQTCIHLSAIALERDRLATTQHRLAYRDMLTDLPNRAAFNRAAEAASRGGLNASALLIIDLDNLKTVNDTFGHRAGDALLLAAAARIQDSVAPLKTYRLGGDEFAVLVDEEIDTPRLEALARTVLDSLTKAVDCDGHLIVPRGTIGGAVRGTSKTAEDLRQTADFALYHAKETRRGGFVAYSEALGTTMTKRLRVIRDVGEALVEERIDAHYQPIVRMDTGEIIGLEALFRVITPDGEVLPAGDFIEATSDVHTATQLTYRMMNIVARDVRAWLDQGIWFQHVGINAASTDFQNDDLLKVIEAAFEREDVPLKHVILEVTESVYMGQAGDTVARQIQKMRANGLRVALDDFGTGFASLTHLLSVPVDIIKIDKSFVARMEPESRAAAIVEGILGIAAKLDIKVVAEGIETASQAAQLKGMGCTLGQGYLFSRPVDRQSVTKLLVAKAQKHDPDIRLVEPAVEATITDSAFTSGTDKVIRYAVLRCGDDWRVVSERRQFGRFETRSAAFQCALRLAREANASGLSVELLQTDEAGELRALRLSGNPVAAQQALRCAN